MNLAFKIRTFALLIPPDHDIYTTYKNSVKNITLANLIKVLSISSYKLCTGIENEIAKKSSTPHTVPHNIKHCNTSLNKPNIYFQPDLCHILVKNEQKCKICQKFDNSSFSKANKISKRQSIMLSTPVERLKLTIQSFRIENKELKEKVMELQQELSKSYLKVSEKLGEDLTSIMASADQRDIPPFMNFFWEEQQKYIKCLSRGI